MYHSYKPSLNNKTSYTSQNIRCHWCSDIISLRIKIRFAMQNVWKIFKNSKNIKIKQTKNMLLNKELNLSILLKIKVRLAEFTQES